MPREAVRPPGIFLTSLALLAHIFASTRRAFHSAHAAQASPGTMALYCTAVGPYGPSPAPPPIGSVNKFAITRRLRG